MRAVLFAALLALLLVVSTPASAHGMRSVFVEIEEVSAGRAALHLRTSVADPSLEVALGSGCVLYLGGETTLLDRTGTVACEGGLAGHALTLRGLGPVSGEAVVWVRYADGASTSHLLTRDASTWTLPPRVSFWAVGKQYVELGVRHILGGYDHLLFLLLLVLTLKTPRSVLLAETCFTLSHSVSFTATALGWVRVAPAPAEACIALSLALVALDIGRSRVGFGAAASPRNVAGLAFLFGLVHGLGFAGGLREIGLPERDVATALASFAAGVEMGQVAFLAAVLAIVHFARRMPSWPKVELVGAYAGGALSTFWIIERVKACF
jgi:HupE / UreJ protein